MMYSLLHLLFAFNVGSMRIIENKKPTHIYTQLIHRPFDFVKLVFRFLLCISHCVKANSNAMIDFGQAKKLVRQLGSWQCCKCILLPQFDGGAQLKQLELSDKNSIRCRIVSNLYIHTGMEWTRNESDNHYTA